MLNVNVGLETYVEEYKLQQYAAIYIVHPFKYLLIRGLYYGRDDSNMSFRPLFSRSSYGGSLSSAASEYSKNVQVHSQSRRLHVTTNEQIERKKKS